MSDELGGYSRIERKGDWGGVAHYGGGDQSMVVMFYYKGVVNNAKSAELGRPYLEDKIYVRIHPPGERLNIVDREATDVEKRRYPLQWQQFRENAPQVSDGTPIDMLFPSSPATAGALKAVGVHTVEACANLSAHAIEEIGMGAQQWSNEASRYLQVANKGVKHTQFKQALDEKDREIATLTKTIEMLKEQLDGIKARANSSVSMDDVLQLMAQQGGGGGRRPAYPVGARQLPPSFDAQTAQIAATHITKDLSKPKKAPKASVPEMPKRARARIGS